MFVCGVFVVVGFVVFVGFVLFGLFIFFVLIILVGMFDECGYFIVGMMVFIVFGFVVVV